MAKIQRVAEPASQIGAEELGRLRQRDAEALRRVVEDLARPLYRARAATASSELGDAIRGCVEQLPAPLREAFVLREMQDMDTAEVCKILGRTVTHVGVQLHRARARLRSCLEAKGWKGSR